MSNPEAATPAAEADRRTWLRSLRRTNEHQENALASVFDAKWGEIEPTHKSFVESFLSMLPPAGRVLDAACGTGKYFSMVLDSGRSLLGVDHSEGYLTVAGAKFPHVPTEKHDLEQLPYRDEFDGVMCVDAMEFVPPEEWQGVLEGFRRALRSGGHLYLTVELSPEDRVRAANEEAWNSGLPVVAGEVIWDQPDGLLPSLPVHGAGAGMDRRGRLYCRRRGRRALGRKGIRLPPRSCYEAGTRRGKSASEVKGKMIAALLRKPGMPRWPSWRLISESRQAGQSSSR